MVTEVRNFKHRPHCFLENKLQVVGIFLMCLWLTSQEVSKDTFQYLIRQTVVKNKESTENTK